MVKFPRFSAGGQIEIVYAQSRDNPCAIAFMEVSPELVSLGDELAKGSANSSEEMESLRQRLLAVRVPDIRQVAKLLGVRLTSAGKKAEMVDRIMAIARIDAVRHADTENGDGAPELVTDDVRGALKVLKTFEEVTEGWSKCLEENINDFHFVHLLTYLVYSREKAFDMKSLKAFRSLKGYRYFADGFVHNVWTRRWPERNGVNITYVRGFVHHSLSTDPPVCVYIALNSISGDVYSGQCNCVAG